jgi:uncharacterized repeat protein (TIGR01451 family)
MYNKKINKILFPLAAIVLLVGALSIFTNFKTAQAAPAEDTKSAAITPVIPAPAPTCITSGGSSAVPAGVTYRILKNEVVVNITTNICIRLTLAIYKLGATDTVIPYSAQTLVDSKTADYGYGTHYISVASPVCSFQSDLFVGDLVGGLGVGNPLAYDYLENACAPPAPTLTCSPASQPIVVGQPVNFTASGGTGTFAWTATGGTPASGSNSTFSTTYNSTGSKTVTVTSGTQTANCGVTVNPAASLTCTPGTQSVTIGQTANFSANGDEGKGLYQWTATGGSPASGSGVNFSTVYTSTGTKIVSVTNGGVSAANCSVTVTASTGATLACSPATQSVLVNQNASFTASGRGDGTSITYSWTATNGTPSGGSGTTFQTRYGSPGTYTVSVRDGSVSRDCTVIVTGQTTTAQITCSPAEQSVAIGQVANFSASGDEGKGLYQWTSTGGSPASGVGVTYSTSYSTEGRKTVTVTNGGASTASCSVTVTASTAPTLSCSPATQTVLVNQAASFTASGRGDGTSITYSWTATSGTPSGGSGTTFQTRYGSPGTYTVSVRDGSVSRDCTVIVNPVIQTQSADLSLTKIANPTTLLVNNLVVFTIVVSNDGPNTATGVSVSDVLPSTLTFNSAVATQGNYNSSDGVWTIGAINSLATASLLITARPNQTGTIVNIAEVTASSLPDPDSTPNNHNANEDDQDSATITVTAGGGGCTSNCGGGTPALVCTPSSQTVPVDQNATLVASGGTGGYSWSAPGGSVTSGVNSSFTTSYSSTGSKVVTLTSGGVNANCTVVVSAGGGGGGGGGGSSPVCSPTSQTVTVGQTVNYSATGGNGAYSWQATSGSITSGTLASFSTSYATPGTYNVVLTSNGLQATCNAIVQAAPTGSLDLAVNKAVNNSTPVVGQQVTYTISLTNNSTVNATGVTVRDLLPTSVTYTSSFTTQGSYDNATGIWTIGSLPAGDSVSLLITVKVNVLGSIENTAAMTTVDQIDTNSGNNTSTVTITVNAAPSLPAAGANTTASILAGLLFMLLAFVARFFMQTTKATVVATTAESSIKTFTRFD